MFYASLNCDKYIFGESLSSSNNPFAPSEQDTTECSSYYCIDCSVQHSLAILWLCQLLIVAIFSCILVWFYLLLPRRPTLLFSSEHRRNDAFKICIGGYVV